jgi:glycerol kinase
MSHILALDQGTSSSRAIIFDADGGIVAAAQRPFEQIFPRPGWVEHDPRQIWEKQLGTAREALAQAGLGAGDIAAIGIANQRETVVIWDRQTGEPIHNAIVWQDRRTADIIARLRSDGHEATVRKKTGLILDPYFSGAKISWLLDHVPEARSRAERGQLAAGTIDSWLLYRLTNGTVHLTDLTNASRTQLMDIHTGRWDETLLELFGVPRSLLAGIRPSSAVLAQTDSTCFGRPIPVAGVAGDQQAALFGQMCTRPGMAKNTYGTGCFLLLHTGQQPVSSTCGLLTTTACQVESESKQYALEGSIFTTGAAIQWLRDGLGIIATAPEVNELAASVPDNGGVSVVPAFAGLGAPHWDPAARGAILGLTGGSSAAHIARATLEGIACQVVDVLEAMQKDAGQPIKELRVDGGAAASDLLMQLQADLMGTPVLRPTVTETTAAGAAYLAGLAVGMWKDVEEIHGQWQLEKRFEPAMPQQQRSDLLGQWRRALERSRGWAGDAAPPT